MVSSALGLLYHGYFFAFSLLHVVVDNDILQRVVSAVTRNGSSLMQVAALMLIIIYIYTLIAFAFYRGSFDTSEGAYCQNLGQVMTLRACLDRVVFAVGLCSVLTGSFTCLPRDFVFIFFFPFCLFSFFVLSASSPVCASV